MQYLCLNTRRAPFDDPAVRRAVTLGVDRASCVSAYLLGHGLAAQFPVSPASGLYPKDLETAYSQDGYASALEAAGLNTGKTRSLTLLVNQESSFRVSTAQTIAAGLSGTICRSPCAHCPMTSMSRPWSRGTSTCACAR